MALFETFKDNFDDNSIDTTKWDIHEPSFIAETNGQLQISTPNYELYPWVASKVAYDLRDNGVKLQIVNVGNLSLSNYSAAVRLYIDDNNCYQLTFEDSTVAIWRQVSGSWTRVTSAVTYNSSQHIWWQFVAINATQRIIISYSADNVTYNSFYNSTWAINVSALKIDIGAYAFSSGASSTFIVDNVNTNADVIVKKTSDYDVLSTPSKTKAAQYTVPTTLTVQKAAAYDVGLITTIQKGSEYVAIYYPTTDKPADYAVATSTDTQVEANYLAQTAPTLQHTSEYVVVRDETITKNAAYNTIESADIQKSANYTTIFDAAIHLDSLYEVSPIVLQKAFMYKVYTKAGAYVTTWHTDVVSDFVFREELNTAGSEVIITLARPADDFGEGDDVDYANKVLVYVIDKEAPNGTLLWSGFISRWDADYDEEKVDVTLQSYGAELAKILLEDSAGNTSLAYNSKDPSDTLTSVMDRYQDQGGTVSYVKKSVFFDGSTGYIPLNHIATVLNGSSTFTVSVWFKCSIDTAQSCIFAINDAATGGNTLLFIGDPNVGTMKLFANSQIGTTGATSVRDNNWHNAVITVNGTNVKLYIDNAVYVQGTSSATYLADDTWTLGMEYDSAVAGDWYEGYIDDFATWNRVLTSQEITDVYNGTIPTSGLIAHYRFDDDIGTTCIDDSTTGTDVTYVGGVYHRGISRAGDTSSISLTATSASYTFNTNTIKEAIDNCLKLAPENWYYYIDQATNILHFHEMQEAPDHTFAIGRDIARLAISKDLSKVVNTVYFSGGGTPPLYKKYTIPNSITSYGVQSERYKDGRVTLEATAERISQGILQGSPEILVRLSVIDSNLNQTGYDIETISLGQMVKVANSGIGAESKFDIAQFDTAVYDYDLSNLSSIVFQITSKEYSGDFVSFTLSTTPPDITKRIQDISRNVIDIQNNDNPTAPS